MIQAKVITDSINKFGNRATTLEVIMPRYILAEFNTHRILSKNSPSSRAIPFSKMIQSVQENPFIPYAWQKDHKGMQGTEYIDNIETFKYIVGTVNHSIGISDKCIKDWHTAKYYAINTAQTLQGNEVTKQLANRLLEPFMYHKVLVSGTEWKNFFDLRCPQYYIEAGKLINGKLKPVEGKIYKSRKEVIINNQHIKELLESYNILEWLKINRGQADIHMMFLAEAIYDAMNESTPNELKEGEWHLPYKDNIDIFELDKIHNNTTYILKSDNIDKIREEKIISISTARCARLSYQTLGDNPVIDYKKDLELYNNLLVNKPVHASPAEHPMRSMTEKEYFGFSKSYLTKIITSKIKQERDLGITKTTLSYGDYYHVVEYGWCRNVRGYISHRALID